MPSKTWFTPPGTTFCPDGMIRLGTVIKDFKRPTDILLEPDGEANPPINLPEVQKITEPKHSHSRNSNSSTGAGLWASFVDVVSASMRLDLESHNTLEYGEVDHEVLEFKRSLTPEALKAILSQPNVEEYVRGGAFGKRPIYIISGLRVAKTSMTVTMGTGRTRAGKLEASGPAAGILPTEAGVDVHGGRSKENADSWMTAPGIIFAFRVNVIREKKDKNGRSEIFSHITCFMAGREDEKAEMEISEVVLEDLLEDPYEDYTDLVEHRVGGEETCIPITRGT